LFDEWAVMGLDCGKHFVLFVGPSSQMSLRAGARMDLSDVPVAFGVVELETKREPGSTWQNPTRPTKYRRLAPSLGWLAGVPRAAVALQVGKPLLDRRTGKNTPFLQIQTKHEQA
jgi:hypothetical protein